MDTALGQPGLDKQKEEFPWVILSKEDFERAAEILSAPPTPKYLPAPDLVIAPQGEPYLYRWHLIPHNKQANLYFHIQVASDPERPLHDHPWDNFSVILSGGYDELRGIPNVKNDGIVERRPRRRRPGDTVYRPAHWAHRLILPDGVPYTMTLFSTGPKVKEWGFWFDNEGWINADDVTQMLPDGRSVHTKRGG